MKTKFPLPCFTFPMVYPLNKVLKEHNMHKISVKKKQVHAKQWPKKFTKIDHFHIDHNAHSTVVRGQFSNFFDAMLYIFFHTFSFFIQHRAVIESVQLRVVNWDTVGQEEQLPIVSNVE